MSLIIVRQNIVNMDVDAVVNAANTELLQGGGVCGAIFSAAGAEKLTKACKKLAPIRVGGAVITPAFDLHAKYIIHAAGPAYHASSGAENERLLRSAYTESLKLAVKKRCDSIAFPLISSGIYGYPKAEALAVAMSAINDFLATHELDVFLTVFDKEAFAVSSELYGAVESYIDEHYVDEVNSRSRKFLAPEINALYSMAEYCCANTLDDLIDNMDEPFSAVLLRLIDKKGMTDVEVYKRANIDRKLFSKIRGKDYSPSKRTVLALAVALELSLEETDDLLERAGFALSHSRKFDVIVEFFIVNGRYDIFEINEMLYQYDQPLLGS